MTIITTQPHSLVIVAPFLMIPVYSSALRGQAEPELWTGLILVGLGRCFAIVKAEYCAILVTVKSIPKMVLRESGPLDISYEVIATSVGAFLGIPLGAAMLSRFGLRCYDSLFLRFVAPRPLVGLLYTILVLFAYQGRQVVHQIVSVVRVAVPLVLCFVLIFFLTLWATRRCGLGYALGAAQRFAVASNNFELAIAMAIATYDPNSDQTLASAVEPLFRLVYIVKMIGNR
ncbi:putative arsenite efflux transporter [Hypoxylon rubiginosum]|uniref:Arsenite efflux transporter n=1 Tax=Hypoxylon rubiginosum TaxID=110542 RepID=A0ACB9Z526_9PEZI|nr:putative arsenite efflux transporter [Hypoxylon rubiginosum]